MLLLIKIYLCIGLALALQVGVKHAHAYAQKYKLPLLGINHLSVRIRGSSGVGGVVTRFLFIQAHCLVARLSEPSLSFPYLSLLISGGHSQLLLCEGVTKCV